VFHWASSLSAACGWIPCLRTTLPLLRPSDTPVLHCSAAATVPLLYNPTLFQRILIGLAARPWRYFFTFFCCRERGSEPLRRSPWNTNSSQSDARVNQLSSPMKKTREGKYVTLLLSWADRLRGQGVEITVFLGVCLLRWSFQQPPPHPITYIYKKALHHPFTSFSHPPSLMGVMWTLAASALLVCDACRRLSVGLTARQRSSER